jgi:hypothetical protein
MLWVVDVAHEALDRQVPVAELETLLVDSGLSLKPFDEVGDQMCVGEVDMLEGFA